MLLTGIPCQKNPEPLIDGMVVEFGVPLTGDPVLREVTMEFGSTMSGTPVLREVIVEVGAINNGYFSPSNYGIGLSDGTTNSLILIDGTNIVLT